MPCSRASIPVHFPVPFCPAVSEIFSTSGVPSVSLCARMAAVISIRYESSSPVHVRGGQRGVRDWAMAAAAAAAGSGGGSGGGLGRRRRAFVPLGEDRRHLVAAHPEGGLHQLVRLADQLHVAVLDAVVHHLDVVAGAAAADPLAARLVALARLRGDRLEDLLDVRPRRRAAGGGGGGERGGGKGGGGKATGAAASGTCRPA